MGVADEERFLDDLIRRRAKSLARGKGLFIAPENLLAVRESESVRRQPGYWLRLGSPREDDPAKSLDMREVADRFPNVGKFAIDHRCRNINALAEIDTLEQLYVQGIAEGETLELKKFGKLEYFSFEASWRSIDFAGAQTRHIGVGDPTTGGDRFSIAKDIAVVSSLELIMVRSLNLNFVEYLHNLNSLELHYMRRLRDLSGIRYATKSLESLTISRISKDVDLSVIATAKGLQRLSMENMKIPSLDFLQNLPSLRFLNLMGSNVLDGRLAQLLDHSSLQEAYWDNRRHYDMKDVEFMSRRGC